jgi:hypothetical protein
VSKLLCEDIGMSSPALVVLKVEFDVCASQKTEPMYQECRVAAIATEVLWDQDCTIYRCDWPPKALLDAAIPVVINRIGSWQIHCDASLPASAASENFSSLGGLEYSPTSKKGDHIAMNTAFSMQMDLLCQLQDTRKNACSRQLTHQTNSLENLCKYLNRDHPVSAISLQL